MDAPEPGLFEALSATKVVFLTLLISRLSRPLSAALRNSLIFGITVAVLSRIISITVGLAAGYLGGWVDAVLMWVTDLFLSLPQLPLLLLLIFLFREPLKAAFGLEIGIFILIVVVIGGFRWMPVARLVRAQFFSLREKEFVEAARALGASVPRQVVRHILPNALGPVIVAGTIDIAAAITGKAPKGGLHLDTEREGDVVTGVKLLMTLGADKKAACSLVDQAVLRLASYGAEADILRALARYIVERDR